MNWQFRSLRKDNAKKSRKQRRFRWVPPESPKREPRTYRLLPDMLTVKAMTKSEALAGFKKQLGIRGRLPMGRMVIDVKKLQRA